MVTIRWMLRFALWIPIACLLLTNAANATGAGQQNSEASADVVDFVDFDSLVRPSSPNTWLVGPADSTPPPDDEAPVFDISAAQLVDAWTEVVGQQTRSRVLGLSEDRLQVEAEQRSAVFGFVDRISFRAVALGQERSTYRAYSRSLVGYSDFGVNRRRLERWITALRAALSDNGNP